MKKTFKLALHLFLMIFSFLIFSCASNSEEDIFAPTNTWVYKDYNYTSSSGETSALRCYFMFSKNGYTNSSLRNLPEASQNSNSTSIKAGLTIVVKPINRSNTSTALINTLGNEYFMCKTFELDTNTETGDSESYSFKMTEAKWNVFYIAYFQSLYPTQTVNPPVELTSSSYSDISNASESIKEVIREKFSWRQILIDILLNI